MFMSPQQFGNVGLSPFEAVTAVVTSATQGFWAVTTEATGYSQKSVANVFSLGEKLSRARRLDEIIQLNSDFARVAFDDFTAEVSKIGSIYANMANQTMRVAQEGVNARPVDEPATNAAKQAAPRKQDKRRWCLQPQQGEGRVAKQRSVVSVAGPARGREDAGADPRSFPSRASGFRKGAVKAQAGQAGVDVNAAMGPPFSQASTGLAGLEPSLAAERRARWNR